METGGSARASPCPLLLGHERGSLSPEGQTTRSRAAATHDGWVVIRNKPLLIEDAEIRGGGRYYHCINRPFRGFCLQEGELMWRNGPGSLVSERPSALPTIRSSSPAGSLDCFPQSSRSRPSTPPRPSSLGLPPHSQETAWPSLSRELWGHCVWSLNKPSIWGSLSPDFPPSSL